MASRAICSRLQRLEAEISELVAHHLQSFQFQRSSENDPGGAARTRSSSAPARSNPSAAGPPGPSPNKCSCPSSRQTSPQRDPTPRSDAPAQSNPRCCPATTGNPCNCAALAPPVTTKCKCCAVSPCSPSKKSVQFATCRPSAASMHFASCAECPRKTYTVQELFKMQGKTSSSSQRNVCMCEYLANRDAAASEMLEDALMIQKTIFHMPSLNETFKAFDSRSMLEERMKKLENENERLKALLEEESRIRKEFMEQAKQEIQLTEKMMDEKIAKIQRQAVQSIKDVATDNKNLMVALCDREKCLRRMTGVAARLQAEHEKNKSGCEYASEVCDQLRERNKVLEEESQKARQEIEEAKAESDKLKSDLKEYKSRINSYKKEIDKLNKTKVQLEDVYNQTALKAESQQADLNRKREIEEELSKLTELLKQNEYDREQLNNLIEELKETIARQKERIEELILLNEEQSVLLKSQKAALDSKDEQIRLSEAEASILKQNSVSLEQKLSFAEESLRSSSRENSQELQKARREIAELKDTLLLKETIINDQAETLTTIRNENERCNCHIDRLKKDIEIKNMETSRLKRDNEFHASELEKVKQEAAIFAEEFRRAKSATSDSITKVKKMSTELESQSFQNQALQMDIAKLEEENQKLKDKVAELEVKLDRVCRFTSAGDMEKQQLLITYLEQQVALQQREWEVQKKVINKEKSKALQTAKFATKKLLETVKDFQRQTEMQRKVHMMLTNMLQEKEQKLQSITSKMGANVGAQPNALESPREVHEVCKKECRVLNVQRSIYSPRSDTTAQESGHNYPYQEEDEESMTVPSSARLLPYQDNAAYRPRMGKENAEPTSYLACFCDQDSDDPGNVVEVCAFCKCFPCQCRLLIPRKHPRKRERYY